MRNYTLKQLLTFIEVAKDRSVSRAAERLFVTQPAVSMQLRQIEDAFGIALVEAAGRNIRLTDAGGAFLVHAIAAVGQLKDMEAVVAEHVGLKKGHINLAGWMPTGGPFTASTATTGDIPWTNPNATPT